jgi:TatA/E family protein of Tat protein translocase
MLGLSAGELILIVFILLLLFGSKKINNLAKNVGKTVHHIKKGADIEKSVFSEKNNLNKRKM